MGEWRVGEIAVRKIVERTAAWPANALWPEVSAEDLLARDWLRPDYVRDDGRFIISFHTFALEVAGRKILVDTCAGNGKPRTTPTFDRLETPFLERLVEAGFGPDAVDTVVCTHLHVDHVGWNTRLEGDRWVPTFPRARYVFNRRECEHWSTEPQSWGPVFEDSVQPVLDAGLADLVEAGHEVAPGVSLVLTAGHTPGHCSVLLRSGGASALITGDMIHHPVQVSEPDWFVAVDEDPAEASRTRHRFLADHGDGTTLVLGTHFAGSSAGVIRPALPGWTWEPR
jgi:glyoxylase-like metal-dependent hydrolase (beta-lactamase superfamily II)